MGRKEEFFNKIRNKIFELLDLCTYLKRIENMDNIKEEIKIKHNHEWVFKTMKENYQDQLTLGIGKLLDKAVMCGNKNLSLVALKEFYIDDSNISKKFDETIKKSKGVIGDYRNKVLAHNDLDTSFNPNGLLIPEFKELETILKDICEILNEISLKESDSSTEYTIDDDPIDGLIFDLKNAHKLEILWQENEEFREYINKFSRIPGVFS